jgi:Raf kinase inhibitor-like YbhB/YbcL family protein
MRRSKTIRLLFLYIILVWLLSSCENKSNSQHKKVSQENNINKTIKLSSTAFKEGEMIPSKYTCDGENISPPIKWENLPTNTKSIALITDDPDAPAGTWVHWIIYNIKSDIKELSEKLPSDKQIPNGAKQGITSFNKTGYGGPCPPNGAHRYYFKVYALDTEIITDELKKDDLLKAMEGHILAQGELMGKYQRKQ